MIVVMSNESCIWVLAVRVEPVVPYIVLLACYLMWEEKSRSPDFTVTPMLRLRYQGTYARQPLIRWPIRVSVYFVLWLGAELAAFGAVVHAIGFMGAIVASILTSLAGLAILRRMGASAAVRLRQAAARKSSEHNSLSRETFVDGTLAALGAVLLILPGFVSDLAGLALAAPSFRMWLSDRLNLGRKRTRTAPEMIELPPREWRRLDGPAQDR